MIRKSRHHTLTRAVSGSLHQRRDLLFAVYVQQFGGKFLQNFQPTSELCLKAFDKSRAFVGGETAAKSPVYKLSRLQTTKLRKDGKCRDARSYEINTEKILCKNIFNRLTLKVFCDIFTN